jgi:AcrR family transcriptional regulator
VAIERPAKGTKQRRLAPADRRKHILEGAIAYFAEVGFDGSTRDLAERLGVKQPLLYRYFPSKDDLIREVYETVYIGRWRPEWVTLITDRNSPLRDRLIRFYEAYAEVQFERVWMRMFLFSGLRGLDINKRYVGFMEDRVLKRICAEIRHSFGLASVDDVPVQPEELAAFWIFHAGVFYYGLRREVYGASVHVGMEQFTELTIDSLLQSFPDVAKRAIAKYRATHRPAPRRVKRPGATVRRRRGVAAIP